ncbi:MAG: DUF4405 domain-containing protein [Oscillospiraceae bacterium]|jgi:hypothetical protein|nr:DUF4405 domain-containing protein [Oscillospiraceae bacterium]
MKPKAIQKMAIDILMTILVLLMMAFHIMGRNVHEWLGAILFCLFILHHVLNLGWYKGLFKGKYAAMRILNATVNMLLLIAMLCMIASGIMLSGEVFAFLGLRLSAIGRPIHMVSTSWGFLLMSVHLGLHWGMVLGMARRMTRKNAPSKVRVTIARVLAAAIVLRGIYAFLMRRIWEKLFFTIEFSLDLS